MLDNLDRHGPIAQIVNTDSDKSIQVLTDLVEDVFQIILFRVGTAHKAFIGHAPILLTFDFQKNIKHTEICDYA